MTLLRFNFTTITMIRWHKQTSGAVSLVVSVVPAAVSSDSSSPGDGKYAIYNHRLPLTRDFVL